MLILTRDTTAKELKELHAMETSVWQTQMSAKEQAALLLTLTNVTNQTFVQRDPLAKIPALDLNA